MHTDGQRLEVSFTGYTAFPHRAPGYNLIVISESYTAMKPFMGAGRYVNYLGDDEPGDPVAAAYEPNH